jgi:aconitase B
VAFAAATGVMPLDMPESVLVRFTGTMQPGITLRDLVHAIPYYALKAGLLTLEKKTKKNVFSGRILEIEGLPNLTCEQAFELSDASAERSAGGCTIKLNKEPIIEYMTSNITLLRWMISEGYGDVRSISRRIAKMEAWIQNPELLEADKDAVYHTTLEVCYRFICVYFCIFIPKYMCTYVFSHMNEYGYSYMYHIYIYICIYFRKLHFYEYLVISLHISIHFFIDQYR